MALPLIRETVIYSSQWLRPRLGLYIYGSTTRLESPRSTRTGHAHTVRLCGRKERRKFIPFPNSIPLWYHLLYPESTYCFTIFSSCFQSLPTIISLYVESIVNRTPCIQDTFPVSNIQESASSSEAAFTQSSVFHLSRDSSLKCINSKSEVLLSTHGAHQVSLAQKWQALWICRQVK